ncbi:exported protein of unknown function [Nitrospira sp. KM1]|nr:exported protein of unknown function [Nitrospira sp. KM1]
MAAGAVGADDPYPIPPQVYTIPFDEIDEATLQAEVATQAMTFVNRLQRNWGNDRSALQTDVKGAGREDIRDKLIYVRNLADHGVIEGYEFRHDSLIRGEYVVLQRPLNGLNEFIGYYQALKTALSAAFGSPLDDRVVWDNDLYQPLPDYWGVAVMIGHLHYHAQWDTPEGALRLELRGDRHSRLFLEYQSRAERSLT